MYDELTNRLQPLNKRLSGLKEHLNLDDKLKRIDELEKLSSSPEFWNNQEKAQQVLKEINELKEWTEAWEKLHSRFNDIEILLDLAKDEQDSSTFDEAASEIEELEQGIERLELDRMLSGPNDSMDAILTIHPGAGGTESQDWAEMLFRMYIRFCERSGYNVSIMDLQAGDEAGIKSATLEVKGKSSFGYLKAEAGVHRLVRISPFDANKRRHTSFASVFVYPEVENDIEIEIKPSEIRVDTYRASGAGGQHVNKTSSAVRITHLPTNIVVQCQNERSQFQNKANAMKILKARLYQKKLEEENEKLKEIEKNKKDIAWGSQIRSYVFHPYTMVKDHRTGVETSNIQQVMDGDLERFIRAYLLKYS